MVRRWFIWVFLLTSGFVLEAQDLKTLIIEAQKANAEKDYATYLTKMLAADELRPNDPTIVYELAKAYALNKRRTRAIQTLNQLLLMDATIAFDQEASFDDLRNRRGYDRLLTLQRELSRQEVHDELFLAIDASELHPESFAILADGTVLLGSIREKRIVKLMPDGSYVNWLETPYGVLGMKIDVLTNTLWVATAALPEMIGYSPLDRGKSIVLQVDLATGFILQGLEYDEGSTIVDIEPDSEQHLWLSNSFEPLLSRDDIDTTNMLGAFTRLTFDLSLSHFNLQGLSLSENEEFLYFSDYIKGLYRINIALGEIEPVLADNTILLKGIDGLYSYKNTLIAIHNGTKPYKVVQYFLNEEGNFIDLEQVINRGGESLGEPTLGQIKDGYFYYLANSPWEAYASGEFKVDDWGPIEIRRIKLD